MELYGITYPPNRPLERPLKSLHLPVLHDFLLFVESNSKGEIILGCSDVAGTYWGGALFHYKNFESTKTHVYNTYFTSTSTTSDAKFIQNNYVLVAEDDGILRLLSLSSEGTHIMQSKDFDKVDRIIQITVWNSNKFAVCTDRGIKVYDIQNQSSIQLSGIFKNHHTDTITSIDASKSDDHIFVSTSADRKACIWDTRMNAPATVIHNNEFSPLTSAVWNRLNKEYLIIGSEAGDLCLLNIKKPRDVIHATHCFDSSIHKLRFSNSGNLAVCGNTSNVLIYHCHNELLTKRHTEKHNTVIRGLTWHEDNLYVCGFNKKLESYCY